jgi:hypothetical protein
MKIGDKVAIRLELWHHLGIDSMKKRGEVVEICSSGAYPVIVKWSPFDRMAFDHHELILIDDLHLEVLP